MATYARDLASNSVVKLATPPQVLTADNTSSALDMADGDGLCNLLVAYGTIHADTTGAVTVTECDTSGGSYTAVTLSGAVTFAGADDNTVVRRTFQRSKRYVKVTFDLSGTTLSAGAAAVIEQQKKVV